MYLPTEKQKVAVIVDQVSKKAAEIGAVKDDAETDLAAAKPALDEALSALNSITQKDIVSLKALKSPPDIVKRIFDCVLLLKYWPIEKVCKLHALWFLFNPAHGFYGCPVNSIAFGMPGDICHNLLT